MKGVNFFMTGSKWEKFDFVVSISYFCIMEKIKTPVMKFKLEWTDDDNVKTTWWYDLKVSKSPVRCDTDYPAGYFGEKTRKKKVKK